MQQVPHTKKKPQTLGATVKNLVVRATYLPEMCAPLRKDKRQTVPRGTPSGNTEVNFSTGGRRAVTFAFRPVDFLEIKPSTGNGHGRTPRTTWEYGEEKPPFLS
jgi:hypothetical protein